MLGRPSDRHPVDDARAGLLREFDAYLSLPVYPGEQQQWRTVAHHLAQLNLDTGRVLSLVASGRPQEANEIADNELQGDFDSTSAAVMTSIELNARQAQQIAHQITPDRARSRQMAVVLNAASAAVAISVCVVVAIQAHRHMKLLWSHNLLLERRADELEWFAGRVAHDVLGPLAVAALALEVTARRLEEDDPAQKAAERGQRAIQRVKSTVDGLLAFARAGAAPEPGARAEVGVILDDLMSELGPAAEATGADLHVEPLAPCAVLASPGVLTSIIANLARNALKYLGDMGDRRVVIRVLEESAAVRIEVEDTGPGIPPDLEEIVFEPYTRARGARVQGLGLGLATVKRLVETHGGRVGLRTVVGRGSLFWFTLPKERTGPEPALRPDISTLC